MLAQIIGLLAAVAMIATMVPQIIMSYKTKSVKDISLHTLLLFTVAMLLWTVYWVLSGNVIVYTVFGLTAIAGLIELVLKIKYKEPERSTHPQIR